MSYLPLLSRGETERAHSMFKRGKDTATIASVMRVTEAHVYNSLHRLRELMHSTRRIA